MPKALVNDTFRLLKFPGKGGWTYVVFTGIAKEKRAKGGGVRVKGKVDGFAFKNYHLMPMADGNLFFPVKAGIRKHIGKEAGDFVKIILYEDADPLEIPEDLLLCLKEEPQAHKIFLSFTESEQKGYINWIMEAKREQTRADRIAKTINRTLQGLNLWERLPE